MKTIGVIYCSREGQCLEGQVSCYRDRDVEEGGGVLLSHATGR